VPSCHHIIATIFSSTVTISLSLHPLVLVPAIPSETSLNEIDKPHAAALTILPFLSRQLNIENQGAYTIFTVVFDPGLTEASMAGKEKDESIYGEQTTNV
jgi:hypothetical protein